MSSRPVQKNSEKLNSTTRIRRGSTTLSLPRSLTRTYYDRACPHLTFNTSMRLLAEATFSTRRSIKISAIETYKMSMPIDLSSHSFSTSSCTNRILPHDLTILYTPLLHKRCTTTLAPPRLRSAMAIIITTRVRDQAIQGRTEESWTQTRRLRQR